MKVAGDALRVAAFESRHTLELVRMWRASFEHGVGIVDPNPIEAQVAHFERDVLPAHTVRVAWRGDAMVGFVASNAESVSQLHVRVEHIGRGIGSHLLRLAQEHSAGSLWLYTFARNARARRFYAHHGFVDAKHGFEPVWQLEDVRFEWVRGHAAVPPR